MSSGVAVSDASPIIALYQIDRLDLLRDQFALVVVPPTIEREVAPSVGLLPKWIQVHQTPARPYFLRHLDPGERDAIALAMHLRASLTVIDDLPGRHAAAKLGLRVIGTLGLLVRAKRIGLVSEVRPMLDALVRNGLYASDRVYREILAMAGEGSPG